MHQAVLLSQPAGQRDDLGESEFHDAAGVGIRGVEHRDAVLRGGGQVDLVGADAKAPTASSESASRR